MHSFYTIREKREREREKEEKEEGIYHNYEETKIQYIIDKDILVIYSVEMNVIIV